MLKEQSIDSDSQADLMLQLKQQKKLIEDFKMSTSWSLTAPLRWASRMVASLFQKPTKLTAAQQCDVPTVKDYVQWMHQFDAVSSSLSANMRSQIDGFAAQPMFSILMPCIQPQLVDLEACIASVQAQIYPNWELCIAVSRKASDEVLTALAQYAQEDTRIKLGYTVQDAYSDLNRSSEELPLLCNHALSMASRHNSHFSVWVLRLNAADLIASKALFLAAKAINEDEKCQIIYADEDVVDAQAVRCDPYFKCDWNPELHMSHNLIGRFGIYRTALMRQVGGYSLGVDEAMDFDVTLRCIELVSSAQIAHLPYVLFHGRQGLLSSAGTAVGEGVKALDLHFQRLNIRAKAEMMKHGYRVRYQLPSEAQPLVSLIIPTRNGLFLLRQCIRSIQQKTTYRQYEIIIVDNGSDDPATLDYFQSLSVVANIRILRIDKPFNYSALNNAAVAISKGELVGLLNNDVEVISSDWLGDMVSHALQNGVGAVGARLWYPNDTLQHGGVVLGLGGVAGHAHAGITRDQLGYYGRASLTQNLSAVTAACLVIKKSIYESVGGLNENDLAVAFNDVDFCLRVNEAGYQNVWTPFAELYHHESATRGYEDTLEKQQRFAKEMSYMYSRWGKLLVNDPAYNPNLTLIGNDFGLAWPSRVPEIQQAVDAQPGIAPLNERLNTLASGQLRIAYFAENVHSSTFRYRAANMVAVLNESNSHSKTDNSHLAAACFFSGDLKYVTQIVEYLDVLVISRARYDPDIAALVQTCQAQKKRVLFDIDDLVFDTQMIDLIVSTTGQEANDEVLNYWYGVVGRMAQTLSLCDGVITTNAFLAEKIKQFINLPVTIVPNFANQAQIAISEPLYQKQLVQGTASNERIRLGYFSGSASHNGDLALISHALERVMAVDARIELVLVGYIDLERAFGARFGGYLKGHLASRVTIIPFVDYLKLPKLLASVDFNLVPLQVNDFTNCKSELKYVDAAIVGVRTIASPVYAYSEVIHHGTNGYLAENDQWEAVFLEAIANKDANTEVHQYMPSAAYQDVQSRFTWKTQKLTILSALGLSVA